MNSNKKTSFSRLRRFYRKSLMSSPRTAGISGAGWILASVFFQTLPVFLSIPILAGNLKWLPMTITLIIAGLFLLILGIGRFICAANYIFRRKKLFFPGLPFIIGAIALFICHPVFDGTLLAVYLLAAAGFCFSGNRDKIKWNAYIPGILLAAMVTSLFCAEYILRRKTSEASRRLAQTCQSDITLETAKQRLKNAFQITREPLKSAISAVPEDSRIDLDLPAHKLSAELKKYRTQHKDFVSSLEKFLQLDITEIGWNPAPGELLFSVYPAHSFVREAVRYLDMNIRSYPEDLSRITEYHNQMVKLRNIASGAPDMIFAAVSINIERKRLASLSSTLATSAWGRSEYFALAADTPDYRKLFLHFIATEAAAMEGTIEYFKSLMDYDRLYSNLNEALYMQMKLYYLANRLRNLQELQTVAVLFTGNTAPTGKELYDKLPSVEKKTGLVLHDLVHRDWQIFYKRLAILKDHRKMAEIAYEVMEHRWSNGGLPRDLGFLGEVPCSEWDGKPFLYSFGELERRDGKRIFGFRISLQDTPLVNCLEVQLDSTVAQNGCSKRSGSLAL